MGASGVSNIKSTHSIRSVPMSSSKAVLGRLLKRVQEAEANPVQVKRLRTGNRPVMQLKQSNARAVVPFGTCPDADLHGMNADNLSCSSLDGSLVVGSGRVQGVEHGPAIDLRGETVVVVVSVCAKPGDELGKSSS